MRTVEEARVKIIKIKGVNVGLILMGHGAGQFSQE